MISICCEKVEGTLSITGIEIWNGKGIGIWVLGGVWKYHYNQL